MDPPTEPVAPEGDLNLPDDQYDDGITIVVEYPAPEEPNDASLYPAPEEPNDADLYPTPDDPVTDAPPAPADDAPPTDE